MKRFTLVLTLAALALPQAGHAGWFRTYGGEVGNCAQITSDGNYIISGRSNLNLVLYMVDTLGNIIWEHTYGRSDDMMSRWVEETSDGGYIIAPRTPSLLKVDSQGDTLWSRDYGLLTCCVQETADKGYIAIGGYAELALIRTDSLGDTVWIRRYSEPGYSYNVGQFIQKATDGGYIISGFTAFADENLGQWENLWLVKTDSQGNKQWSKIYGKQENGYASKGYCIRQTSDEGYIITGVVPGGLWLLKADSLGDTLWTKTYGLPDKGTGFSIQRTLDYGYIITGVTETFLSAWNAGTSKLWLLKTDSLGDTLWTRFYDANDWAVGRCVQQTSDSGYIVLGYSSLGIYLLKTDSLGLLAIEESPIPPPLSNWEITESVGNQIRLSYGNRPSGFKAYVFDVLGREVDRIEDASSTGVIKWGSDYPSGVYFIQVNENQKTRTAKVVLVR